MTQLELFAGIGGFGLAGHWAGIETVCQVEIDPFCQKVLQKNFPHAQRHDDIHTFDGSQWRGAVDIISGGFPCQPFSSAGKRKGEDDERHLWPQMLRVIKEVSPRWVVGENVAGIINLDRGRPFRRIVDSLENEGYTVECFDIPAYSVGLQTLERHIWIVAEANSKRLQRGIKSKDKNERSIAWELQGGNTGGLQRWDVSKSEFHGVHKRVSARLDGCMRSRVKAIGNAIIPQVAYQIFKAIVELESTTV